MTSWEPDSTLFGESSPPAGPVRETRWPESAEGWPIRDRVCGNR